MVVTQMERMEKSLESVTKNFATLRTGRANPAMLDRVKVKPRLNSCIVPSLHCIMCRETKVLFLLCDC